MEVLLCFPQASGWSLPACCIRSAWVRAALSPKPLDAAEERKYLSLAAAGDLEARNILIERNLRLVAHIMKKYYTQTADQEDLISIGTIGLIKAVSTFDATKGARLATYASRCIENAILSQRNNRRLRWKTMNLLGQNGLCSAA